MLDSIISDNTLLHKAHAALKSLFYFHFTGDILPITLQFGYLFVVCIIIHKLLFSVSGVFASKISRLNAGIMALTVVSYLGHSLSVMANSNWFGPHAFQP